MPTPKHSRHPPIVAWAGRSCRSPSASPRRPGKRWGYNGMAHDTTTDPTPGAGVAEMELAPPAARENLEGSVPPLASDDEVREALEKAFDYRGDVTITLKDGA